VFFFTWSVHVTRVRPFHEHRGSWNCRQIGALSHNNAEAYGFTRITWPNCPWRQRCIGCMMWGSWVRIDCFSHHRACKHRESAAGTSCHWMISVNHHWRPYCKQDNHWLLFDEQARLATDCHLLNWMNIQPNEISSSYTAHCGICFIWRLTCITFYCMVWWGVNSASMI